MHFNEWDAPSYDSAISHGPKKSREPQPLPSFELPDGQSYAEVADALRREARTRLRSQMGTSKDSIFFAELMTASEPPAPAPAPTPAERWRTEYSNKFLSHSTEEVVLRNVHPFGGATTLGTDANARNMADPQRGASPPVSETVKPSAPDPAPEAYNQDAYAEESNPAVTFAGEQHAAPAQIAEEPPAGDAQQARAAREKRNRMRQKQIKKKLRRPDTTSRDMADTAVAAAMNNGRTPFHCYGRGASTHALPGGELHPNQSIRQGCGRDRKTHNVKAATFARSAGGKPEYQQVYSSALYGRDAVKDFDDYIRRDHRTATKRGEDPLTRVAWPPPAEDEAEDETEPHSFRQTQRQNNRQALNALDSWADAHDLGTQKWLQRWQKRQHDELAKLELWDRLATPAAHNQQPKIKRCGTAMSSAESKARAEAQAWAAATSAATAAAQAAASAPALAVAPTPEPAPEPALSKPLSNSAKATISGVASAEATACALAAGMSSQALRAAVTSQRVALLDSLGDDVVPLDKLWLALKPLLLRSDLPSEAILAAKQAVALRDADEMVDASEFILELIALQDGQGGDEAALGP